MGEGRLMDFSISSEQRMLCEVANKIAREFDNDYFERCISEGHHPDQFIKRCSEQGLLGLTVPEEYGGAGLDYITAALVTKELCRSPAGMFGGTAIVNSCLFGGEVIAKHGTKEQKERYLPPVCRGALWAGGFTEANSGSNITRITTRATREGDQYRINGSKMYISHVRAASHILLLSRTSPLDEAKKAAGVSLVVVDLPNARVQATPLSPMGNRTFDVNAVFFDDVMVPVENRIGAEGGAWDALFDVLNPERIIIAASAIGAGYYLIERAVEQAKERRVWRDTPIGAHQAIAFPLAEAKTRLDCAWLKTMEAAWLHTNKDPATGISSTQAKHAGFLAANYAADRALQTFGGSGYIVETGIERHYRDLRVGRIAPVSDEMALAYLAQHDLGLPRSY